MMTMDKLVITIETGNAAFDDGYGGLTEVSKILRSLAAQFDEDVSPTFARDTNGNRCCEVQYD
jgi:hypothetical protein